MTVPQYATVPPYITGEQMRRVLPMEHAVMALEQAFRAHAGAADPPHTTIAWRHGELLVTPSEHGEWAGAKLATVTRGHRGDPPDRDDRSASGDSGTRKPRDSSHPGAPVHPLDPSAPSLDPNAPRDAGDVDDVDDPAGSVGRINGTYVLFDATALIPRLLVDAAELTALRSAAVSALATRYLAHTDARTLVVFGTGPQARAHVRAMLGVRQLAEVRVVSRAPARAAALAAELTVEHGLPVIPGTAADVARADIVCTCTDSSTPLFDGRLLADTAHVNAVGGHRLASHELDDATVQRAFVVVERSGPSHRAAEDRRDTRVRRDTPVHLEAGDLSTALESDITHDFRSDADLRRIVTEPWTRPHRPTLFRSIGLPMEDLTVAAEIATRVLTP
ncbi:ornithine cyclodeaminase family protein [Sphaerisporangium perillae]|uniref:ornithine cyclodeaminase family protein n=1 Tax=Sphaerisporangium perillae TaxID=2935860 RepID=UPI00200DB39D|nr:hypothetical protein [Sphaerisporangium perillae]